MLLTGQTAAAVRASMMRSAKNRAENKLAYIMKLKDLYDNMDSPLRPPSMSERIYSSREEAYTPVAFTSLIVNKIANLLYGRMVARSTGDKKLDAMVASAYAGSRGQFMRLAKISSLAGYAAVRVCRDWAGGYSFHMYGFDEVEPILNIENPFGKVDGIQFNTNVQELPDWVKPLNPNIKKHLVYTMSETITRHVRDSEGNIKKPGEYIVEVDGKRVRDPFNGLNPMGDLLGAVWWRGADHPFDPWGGSDILHLLETLESLNELLTDGRELMIWGLHAPVVTNSVGHKDWKYSPRSIWGAGQGEGIWVKRLESNTAAIHDLKEYIALIIDIMHQTSRIPSISVGSLQGLGQASSGRAFEIAMTPAKELVAEKENAAIPQEMELLTELVGRMGYYGDIKGLGVGQTPDLIKIRKLLAKATIEFAPLSFPQPLVDETLTGQVAAGVRSREDAIQTLHPSWDDNQIKAEIRLIDGASPEVGVDAAIAP